MNAELFGMQIGQVMSVYSGRNGKCCCGCAGKHYYNSANVAVGSKHRGYTVRPEEINDRMVGMVLTILKNSPKVEGDGSFYSTVIGKRLYVVYPVPKR